MKRFIFRSLTTSLLAASFVLASLPAEALTLSEAPGTPTSPLTTYINGADRASFSVTVPLSTSTTGAVAGDTLELYVNGVSFPSPVTAVLSSNDVDVTGSHTFTLALTFANNLSNGVKNFTAALSSDGVSTSTASLVPLTLTLDTAAPTLSPVSLSSDDATTTVANVGNVVTLSFTSNESIAAPTVTLAGRSATAIGGPTSWSASTTMISADTDGSIPFSIAFADLAGNVGTTVSTVRGGGQNVTFDHTPPVLVMSDIVTAASSSAGTIVQFPALAADAIGGNKAIVCDRLSGSVFAIGTTTVSCTASDALNNSTSTSFTVLVRSFTSLSTNTSLYAGAQQVVVNATTSATSTVSIPVDATSPTLNLAALLSTTSDSASVSLGGALAVEAVRGGNTIAVAFPAGLTVTGPSSWNGVLNLPTVKASDSVTVTPTANYRASVGQVIEIGAGDVALTLDRAVRILIPGAWQAFLGWSRNGTFGAITTVCNADNQGVVDAQLSAGADCRVNIGQDTAIWTKHFSSFFPYGETPISSVSSGGNGGGGGGGGGGFISAQTSVSVQTAPATPSLSVEPVGAVLGASTYRFSTTLKKGSRGTAVKELQKILKEEGLFDEEITGLFGNVTLQAVKAYQKKNKLEAVGEVGPATRKLLNARATSSPAQSTDALRAQIDQLLLLVKALQAQMKTAGN
ncbi:peptidoglycan-binding protein [Candidatus Parcubacteria bacterium]|nr:peptidoglycan-binding protein [Candidatus Parcubacteria bacterium]